MRNNWRVVLIAFLAKKKPPDRWLGMVLDGFLYLGVLPVLAPSIEVLGEYATRMASTNAELVLPPKIRSGTHGVLRENAVHSWRRARYRLAIGI
jgi:hypothetical protein